MNKSLLLGIILLAVLFIAWHIRGRKMSDVERPQAEIANEKDGITFITMPAQIIATVRTSGNIGSAPSSAFGSLAGYIFGDNKASGKIAMTAPVTTKLVDEGASQKIAMTAPVTSKEVAGGVYETAFIMPAERTMETLPVPNNKNVTLKEIPAQNKAVWTFGGYATESTIAREREKFQSELSKNNVKWTGEMTVAQYNDPLTPPWMRRNELWVDLAEE